VSCTIPAARNATRNQGLFPHKRRSADCVRRFRKTGSRSALSGCTCRYRIRWRPASGRSSRVPPRPAQRPIAPGEQLSGAALPCGRRGQRAGSCTRLYPTVVESPSGVVSRRPNADNHETPNVTNMARRSGRSRCRRGCMILATAISCILRFGGEGRGPRSGETTNEICKLLRRLRASA